MCLISSDSENRNITLDGLYTLNVLEEKLLKSSSEAVLAIFVPEGNKLTLL